MKETIEIPREWLEGLVQTIEKITNYHVKKSEKDIAKIALLYFADSAKKILEK